MALSLGGGRRRWAGRAGCGGGRGGGARCRHFHVHYHLPRSQVCAFLQSPRSLPRLSLLCSGLVILPVLFFAVVAFLVCFGWFTMVYFVSSLLSKGSDHECFKSGSVDRVRDADELRGEDEHGGEKEERDMMNRVTEPSARDSAASEVCVERLEIKEVFVDGFFDDSRGISPGICMHHNERAIDEKLVKEVMVFETNKEGLKSICGSNGSSERHQVPAIPVNWSMEELDVREFSTPHNSAELHRAQDSGEFFGERKEVEACTPSPNFDLIDKHETRMAAVDGSANDFKIRQVAYSDGPISVHDGLGYEQKKVMEQEYNVKSAPELPVDSVTDLEASEEQHEVQKVNTDYSMLPEGDSMEEKGKEIVGISDEVHCLSNENETFDSLPDSVCENKSISVAAPNDSFNCTNADEDAENEKDLTENNKLEASSTTSLVCDFAENHQTTKEEISASASEDNVREDTSLQTSVPERIEDEDEKIDDYYTSKHLPDCQSSGGPKYHGGTYVESLMCLPAVKIKLRVSKGGQKNIRFIRTSDHQSSPYFVVQ
ncbi:hypothetical protein ACP70R_031783 [Stipagrostis hirtigluma subsp. patula]